jgi:hypothetical protein
LSLAGLLNLAIWACKSRRLKEGREVVMIR